MNRSRNPPWSDLPQELISAIAELLVSNPIDVLRFRSVCKSWSSSLSLPPYFLSPYLPLEIPRPPPHLDKYYYTSSQSEFLSLTIIYALRPQSTVDSSSSSSSWLLFVDQLNPRKVSIRHPFSKRSFSMPLDFPHKLNLLDFHVSEIGRYYNHTVVRHHLCENDIRFNGVVEKVVLLSNGLLAVVVLFVGGKLGLLRLEDDVEAMQWEVIHDGKGFRFDDIVNYKGRILGVDRRGRVYELGYNGSLKMNLIVPPIAGGGGRRKRLVESLGLLYLVVRCNVDEEVPKTARFKVYKLDDERIKLKWVEVSNLGDQIFFVGLDFSFAASAQELGESCRKNCIIFGEHSFKNYSVTDDDYWLFHDLLYFDVRVGVSHYEDGAFSVIESHPSFCNLMWPPPDWLWPDKSSKLLGMLEVAIERVSARIHDEDFKVLSPHVGKFIFGDDVSQPDNAFLRQAGVTQKFLNEIVVEIDKEYKRISQDIIGDSTSRKEVKERRSRLFGLLHEVQTPGVEANDSDDWLSNEMERRLDTHVQLDKILKDIILGFEGKTEELENDDIRCSQQACAATNEETR